MGKPFYIEICKQDLWLLPEKATFWPAQKMLIISDAHLGKAGHFRKAGIAIPQSVFLHDVQKLFSLIQTTHCETLLVSGDFFHSVENKELDLFRKWRNDFPFLNIQLVMGNHDILPEKLYAQAGIECIEHVLFTEPFFFIHDCEEMSDSTNGYGFCGHIHPGVRISSKAKQTMVLPCFHFTKKYCIMPAFSAFAGSVPVKKNKGDRIVAIAKNSLIEINT